MGTLATFLTYALVLWTGILIGFFVRTRLLRRFQDYSGTIVVARDDIREKTVYSLVLDDYPEKLEFKKEVVFKVDSSGQSSNRT